VTSHFALTFCQALKMKVKRTKMLSVAGTNAESKGRNHTGGPEGLPVCSHRVA
jgi:hypothetical protein